jgi:uncharacterized protein YbjT (DUF2867 family)
VGETQRRILVTGASGYVGGRLLARLEERGYAVRAVARRPELVAAGAGARTQVVAGDALRAETLPAVLEGVDSAYYLIHSMASSGRAAFEEQDRLAARNFARAAREAGVRRIIYLGALGDEQAALSPHLRSRHEVGRLLRESGLPVIELRASIVIGSGSLSFEMIRALVERLPVMVTPRWVGVIAQPIAIDDLLAYLEAALGLATTESRIYEIGGAERVSYGELMREYARQRGLRRLMLPVPVLTPWLSSLWLGLVTPLFARVGRALIESICHETVVRDARALRDFAIAPMGARQAIRHALSSEDLELAQTRRSDALSSAAHGSAARAPAAAVRQAAALLCLLLCVAGARAEASELARADAHWARRAEGQVDAVARPEPVLAAIEGYQRAIAAAPAELKPYWKLMRAFWFAADFASRDKAEERRRYEQAHAVAERALAALAERVGGEEMLESLAPEALAARLPQADRRDAAEIYFWHAVNLGAWTRIAGTLAAVRAGVAGTVHEATLRSIALDPDVEQGGAIRMLSRIHSELPRVPLLSGWVDREKAVPLAERALSEYPQHPGNAYLLGLAILSNAPERRAEALRLIEGTATLEPRADQLVEDLVIQIDARKLLEQTAQEQETRS